MVKRFAQDEIESKLRDAVGAGRIWNVDYVELKNQVARIINNLRDELNSHRLGSELSAETSVAFDAWCLAEGIASDDFQAQVWASSRFHKASKVAKVEGLFWSVRDANAFTLLGYCKNPDRFPAEPRWDVVRNYLKKVETLVTLLEEVKPLVVKGRKPAENPKENERTLENTGTCGVCGRNIKLWNGIVYDHGYELPWIGHGDGTRTTGCFGVGYKPIETSPEVLVAYKAHLEWRLKSLPGMIAEADEWLRENPNPFGNRYPMGDEQVAILKTFRAREHRRFSLQQELDYLTARVPELEELIVSWVPRALPGDPKA